MPKRRNLKRVLENAASNAHGAENTLAQAEKIAMNDGHLDLARGISRLRSGTPLSEDIVDLIVQHDL